jgi:AraC-like DNA-binding protein
MAMTSPPSAQREWAHYRPGPVEGVTQLQARFVGHVFERHSHDTYAIGVTTGGVQRFTCRGARHDGVPGDLILFNPDEPHDGRAGVDEGFRYAMVYVPPVALGDMLNEPDCRTRRPCFRSPRVHAHHSDDLRIEALARIAGLSRAHLTRAFTRAFGVAPHGYLNAVRLRHAQQILLRGQSIAEAAAACGFVDQSHLTRRFKGAFGAPPGASLVQMRGGEHLMRDV